MEKLQPKKSLGQHFLKCRWVVSTLIKAAQINRDDTVLEIGPGTGVLTSELAKIARYVIAVEKDEHLAASLKQSMEKCGNVEIAEGDILKIFSYIIHSYKLQAHSYKLVSNIPYYLTSRLIRLLLEAKHKPEIIALTIQKEVAERINAKPPHMNLLAVAVQAYGTPKIIKKVPAECFRPKPKVDSSIIVISDISDNFFLKNNISETKFFEVVRYAFSQKRKTLLNSLSHYYEAKPRIENILERETIKKTARPQELSLEQWAHIVALLPTEASPR